jgi:predicted AAA+ superfamily ATPase
MSYQSRLLREKLRHMVRQFAVVVISGGRQVGKSTLLRHELPDWEQVVLDPALDVGNARQDPDLFLDNHPAPLVLDGIQYAPELVPAIKRRIDRTAATGGSVARTPGQYVVTGSQQWSVLRSASESLAGRAVFLDLEGFALAELAGAAEGDHWLRRYLDAPDDFVQSSPGRLTLSRTVLEQVWRGFIPETERLEDEWIPEFHRAFLRTYLERDVRLLGDVSDWQSFGRFVQLAAALTAQEVNFTQLGREIGVTSPTAQRWLAMLRASFQWFEVPPYHGNPLKRLSSRPKGYFADTGLACSLQVISNPRSLAGHPLVGRLFESAVAAEIRKLSATLATPPTVYHWRTHGGAEVDLLLERDGLLHPIEIKLASRASRADLRGIQALRETYPRARFAPALLICPAERFEPLAEDVYVLPWDAA